MRILYLNYQKKGLVIETTSKGSKFNFKIILHIFYSELKIENN